MATSANSTLAPSRRDFFGSAVGAGAAAAQPPIFTVAIFAADAALLALGVRAAGLIAESDRLWRDVDAADELIEEMARPVPQKPRDVQLHATDAAYLDAMRRYETEKATYDERHAQITTRTSREAKEANAYAADEAMADACLALAGMRATTLEGLVAKARAAGSYNRAGLRDSIVADLLVMGEAA